MQDKLTEIFQKAKYEPEANFAGNIWLAISLRNKWMIRLRSWAFAATGFASLAGLVPAVKVLLSDLAQSGFYEYFSLIFSDSKLMISYWQELIFSLAESLPIASIIFTLSLLFISFLSLRYLMKQIGRGQLNFAS